MRGRVRAVVALTNAFAWLLLAGCYAKTLPVTASGATAPAGDSTATRTPVLVGVRSGEHGDNIDRLLPERIVHRFAERLAETGAFSDVVFPLTVQSPAVPDALFELSVSSSYDLHRVSNLAKDVAVGLSILLLQPVLPTVYELEVQLAANTPANGSENLSLLLGTSRTRFEFTWFRASEESIQEWHDETTNRAIDELVDQIVDRYGAGPETPGL